MENLKGIKYLYHATPSCNVTSIKRHGLGGKLPIKRFWDYVGTPYENISQGVFLAIDEYVAESYVEASEAFEELSDRYEEKYGKELDIVVFRVEVKDLSIDMLEVDTNQQSDEEGTTTYFYKGVIPYENLTAIKLY